MRGLGKAEVEDFDHALRSQKEIRRFDVAVGDSSGVRHGQAIGHAETDIEHGAPGNGALSRQAFAQRLFLQQLGDRIGDTTLGGEGENGQDVRMGEGGEGFCRSGTSQ